MSQKFVKQIKRLYNQCMTSLHHDDYELDTVYRNVFGI